MLFALGHVFLEKYGMLLAMALGICVMIIAGLLDRRSHKPPRQK